MSASLSNSTEPVTVAPDGALQDPVSASPEGAPALLAEARPIALTYEQLLATEAMRLLLRLDRELLEARAQWNQDWFRRVMRIRPHAVSRLQRRWVKIDPTPAIPLGSLQRRYHANLAGYRYELR